MTTGDSTPGGNAQRFYGKYRGTVRINIDPEQIGRVMLQVPDVFGNGLSSWAMPCVPAAGIQAGCFIVPPVGSQVWVEFEQGDSNYPIWTGGFWGESAEIPTLALSPPPLLPGQNIVLQTTGQSMLLLSDAPPTPGSGGILLKSGGATILVNASGIFIDNGHGAKIQLAGNSVDINSGALTVT